MAPAPASPGSPLRGRYTVKNPALWWYLRITDAILSLVIPRRDSSAHVLGRRVLIAVGGHLGDAVVLTASIRRLSETHPDVEIGVVLPSWSRIVLEGHPSVRWIHTIDHWKLNRSRASRWRKWRQYRRSRRDAIRQIREVGYDSAIDVYAYFPNMAVPLWLSGIPARVGFESGGFAALYTSCVAWGGTSRHMAERQADAIRTLSGGEQAASELRYDIPLAGQDVRRRLSALLADHVLAEHEYAVVHMGSGVSGKMWPAEKWREIIPYLREECRAVVFTGQGKAECAGIGAVIAGQTGCVDLSGQLEWLGLVEIVRGARVLVTVDTATAHIAAATGTASVVIWPALTNEQSWRPLAANAHLVPREADAREVVEVIERVLHSSTPAPIRSLGEGWR